MIIKINDWLAVKLTTMMSNMWCVYVFFLLVTVPLFLPNIETICMYLSSSVLQLIALPLIMTGQNLLSKNSENRAAEDHATLMEAITDIRHIMTEEDTVTKDVADVKVQLAEIQKILAGFGNFK